MNANPMAPAIIVIATEIARDSQATTVIATATVTVKGIRGVALAGIVAPATIGKTSEENGESATIVGLPPIAQAACPARLGSARVNRQREAIRVAPDRA